jgi:AraC-like DNA-binding protein
MQIEVISQRYHEELAEFKQTHFKRSWNILVLVVEGEYSLTFTGSRKKQILRKNDIALIPAETEIERELLSPFTGYHISFFAGAEHPFYLSSAVGRIDLPKEQTYAIFKAMERAFMLPDNRELITHTVGHIFVQGYLFGKSDRVKLKPLSRETESAIRYMRQNLDKKIDMDALAEQVFLSHSGLIWKFKQELNTTPSGYLILLRLRYAKQLLLNYPYSVSEISEMCGYSNPYYFTNAFHRYSGMSPTEFRRHYLKDKS